MYIKPKERTILSTGTCSSAHTYGNVASSIKEIIKSLFPKDFFKYIHITTELVSKEARDERVNTDMEFSKKVKPLFVINPSFSSLNEEDKFLGGTLLTSNNSTFNGTISRKVLMDIFNDNKKNIGLLFSMNRDRLVFEINMFMPTLFSQLDVYKNMKNQMNWDSPSFINVSLESMIPRTMISYIGKLNNINIDENQSFIMLDYLNKYSCYPITYKMRNSTSRDEFFMYYGVKFTTTFSELEMDEGNKKGMVDDSFRISFKVTVDFNLPGAYYLAGTPDPEIQEDIQIIVESAYDKDFIPIFTFNNLFDSIKPDNSDFKLYSSCLFKTEKDSDSKTDTLEITPIFKSAEMHDLIKYHIASNIDVGTFIEIKILKDNVLITDWDIDWNDCSISIHNSDSESTYRLIVFINQNYANTKIRNLIENEIYNKGINTKNIVTLN